MSTALMGTRPELVIFDDVVETPVNKHIIIYHAISEGVACDDGFAAAWATWQGILVAEPNAVITLYEGIYGRAAPLDLINEEIMVHIVDFSYDSKTLDAINHNSRGMVVLDHHKTAVERFIAEPPQFILDRNGLIGVAAVDYTKLTVETDKSIIKFDMAQSGAMLAWNYYNKEEAPELIKRVQDNDLWKFAMKGTKEYIAALRSYPQTFGDWTFLNEQHEHQVGAAESFLAQGEAILRAYNQYIQMVLKTTKEPINILGHDGLSCNGNKMFASDLGHILAEESGTFGAVWFKKSDGNYEYSLRSNGEYDVAAIAKEYGGGGHKNAAGFTTELQLWHI